MGGVVGGGREADRHRGKKWEHLLPCRELTWTEIDDLLSAQDNGLFGSSGSSGSSGRAPECSGAPRRQLAPPGCL